MVWQDRRTWQPEIDEEGCTHCGRCLKVCPHSPQCITEYAAAAQAQGARFGLPQCGNYFIAYDKDESKRILSASGGVTSALLEWLLSSGTVDGVVAALPLTGAAGVPHFEMKVFRSVEEFDRGRSSHYHPLSYDKVLGEISASDGSFALVGVPCVMRGLVRLPSRLQKKIKYKVCLACSHNVTGAFSDCLAGQEGIGGREPWQINLRDKQGIPDANNFNNLFVLPDRQVRENRFDTAFTDMWRNYFFAQECCLYCADFYGVDADISIKDAWGRLSGDPLGTSLVIVNNRNVVEHLNHLKSQGRLFLEECDVDEVFNSQVATAVFKHEKVRDRLVWKKVIKRELDTNHPALGWNRRWLSRDSHEYWRLWLLMRMSNFFYFRLGKVPVKGLLVLASPLAWKGTLVEKIVGRMTRFAERLWSKLARSVLLFLGLRRPKRSPDKSRLRVLIAGGYGYGNVGDEAQLAANLQHWKKAVPKCRLTVLTPNQEYTEDIHGPIRTELATRLSLFGKGELQYFGSDRVFKRRFFLVAALCLFNACLIRSGMPTFGLSIRQARLLDELNNSDLLFLSGGGYLTGMTLTRLWDNMLLIRLAHALGVPTVLSGQTIGVFKDRTSRYLAKWGLKKADLIYLRDHIDSPKDLADIGIPAGKTHSTFDDALFYEPAPVQEIRQFLEKHQVDPEKPYLAVNCHYWGQSPEDIQTIIAELTEALDRIKEELGYQIVFVSMHFSDEDSIHNTMKRMRNTSFFPPYGYDPSIAVGIVQNAALCLTMKHHPIVFAMAGKVPTVSCVFDEYYWHKNLGAMSIFGQEAYLIDARKTQKFSDELTDKTIEANTKREEIRSKISKRLKDLENRAGEPIYIWAKS
jgi:coenzyme F420-reducing hydrogenase beta subunit/polysaccharide pyruvyl transferase WcaK-like protein